MEERRVKTFIELTRQTLDEERVSELDFRQRSRSIAGDVPADDKRRRERLNRKR